jgi:hypothetical protein
MKNKKLFAVPVLALGVFVLCATAYAQNSDQGNGAHDKLGPYRLLTTINIPGLTRFDISWVDSKHARYYLANRGNAAAVPPIGPNIPVIDTERDELLYEIPVPEAPNGVVAIHRTGNGEGEPGAGTLVVGGAPNPPAYPESLAMFIDLAHPFAPPVNVSTGGNHRADELAYDPRDHIILIANDQDIPSPFITFISTETPPHVLGKIVYDGTSGNPKSTGGIEQPVWDKRTRKFYLAIPSTAANPNGEVDEIDPMAMKITRIFPTSCGPAGLALIPSQRLMTSCGDVLDVATGGLVTHVTGVAADEIWFNSGDERVYFGHNPAYVVDAETYQMIVGTGANGPPIPAGTTHSIAADSENNHIFIPVSAPVQGVRVYTDDVDNGKGH